MLKVYKFNGRTYQFDEERAPKGAVLLHPEEEKKPAEKSAKTSNKARKTSNKTKKAAVK